MRLSKSPRTNMPFSISVTLTVLFKLACRSLEEFIRSSKAGGIYKHGQRFFKRRARLNGEIMFLATEIVHEVLHLPGIVSTVFVLGHRCKDLIFECVYIRTSL